MIQYSIQRPFHCQHLPDCYHIIYLPLEFVRHFHLRSSFLPVLLPCLRALRGWIVSQWSVGGQCNQVRWIFSNTGLLGTFQTSQIFTSWKLFLASIKKRVPSSRYFPDGFSVYLSTSAECHIGTWLALWIIAQPDILSMSKISILIRPLSFRLRQK